MKSLLFRKLNSLLRRYFKGIPRDGAYVLPPDRYDIEPTTHCNLSCDFCQVSSRDPSMQSMMSYRKFSEILSKIPYARYIVLQGMGEPFLNKQITSMIALCNKKKINVEITTNGTALPEKLIAELFRSPPKVLYFSLDAATAETFREMRGSNHFDKVCEAIRLAVRYKRLTKSDSTVRIWTILSKKNHGEIVPILRLAKTLGVDEMVLQPKITGYGDQMLQTHNDNTHQVAKITLKIYESEFKAAAVRLRLPFRVFYGNYYEETCHCPFLRNMPYITVYGEVVPCCVIANPQIISMGNIFESPSFDAIWNGQKYRTFRRSVIAKDTRPHFCRSCYAR